MSLPFTARPARRWCGSFIKMQTVHCIGFWGLFFCVFCTEPLRKILAWSLEADSDDFRGHTFLFSGGRLIRGEMAHVEYFWQLETPDNSCGQPASQLTKILIIWLAGTVPLSPPLDPPTNWQFNVERKCAMWQAEIWSIRGIRWRSVSQSVSHWS